VKKTSLIIVTLLALALSAAGQTRKGNRAARPKPAAPVDKTLKDIERETAEAFKNKDVAALNRILAPDFIFTAADGQVLDRAGYIDVAVKKINIESYALEDLVTRGHGDTCIVAGRWSGKFENEGKKMTATMRFTDTFVKRLGRWQMIASHETMLSHKEEQSVGEEITTESGLKYIDLVAGTGKSPAAGQMVTAHYTGWHENGTKFDSSIGGQPISFPIGMGRVIRGWDEGLMTMKVGGKRKLVIPPHLGYGARGAGGGLIPPNATLIFEVELLDVK
jgi:FKBP-type peptidyl-prolyl cis-trans isomerase